MFNTIQSNLKAFFEELTYEDIQMAFDLSVFHRGLNYFQNNHVIDKALLIAQNIRHEFKRRRNLMEAIRYI